MVLEQTHAHVSIENLSELILENLCALLHELKFLLLCHVLLIWYASSGPSMILNCHEITVTAI